MYTSMFILDLEFWFYNYMCFYLFTSVNTKHVFRLYNKLSINCNTVIPLQYQVIVLSNYINL